MSGVWCEKYEKNFDLDYSIIIDDLIWQNLNVNIFKSFYFKHPKIRPNWKHIHVGST